jgi:hypothetical protein
MAGTSLRRCAVALIPVGGLLTAVADAAGQDHHDDAPAAQTIIVAPRAEARLGDQEVVITHVDRSLIVYLQRYVDGVPTTGAEIELVVDFLPSYPEEIAPGVYVATDVALAANREEIELKLAIDGRTDSAVLPLVNPAAVRTASQVAPRATAVPGIIFAIAAATIFAMVNALFLRRAARQTA